MFVHVRLLRPFLAMNLLFMSLPLVLGGYGRNTFINLGFALGNSALFYGGHYLLPVSGRLQDCCPPALAAWAPLIVFGTIATAAVGQDPNVTEVEDGASRSGQNRVHRFGRARNP